MVALVTSILITVLLCGLIVPVAKRRPAGAPLTWGEAMVAAAFIFAVLFMAWGVVPHEWLAYADNELKWRSDKLLFGPGDVFKPKANGGFWPFTMTFQHLRDVIAAGIYGVTLGAFVAAWVAWQKRGTKTGTAVAPVSSYGRPLARKV